MIFLKLIRSRNSVIVLVALLAIAGSYMAGRITKERDHVKEELEDFQETVERIDQVPESTDRDTALERLRANGDIR